MARSKPNVATSLQRRRAVLALGAAGALGIAPRLAFAGSGAPGGNRFVLVILRGGMDGLGAAEKADWSRRMSGALIGIAGAIGALGGVGINIVLRASYLSAAKSATLAFWVFLAFYMLCAAITWLTYVRRPVSAPAIEPAAREAVVAA